MRGNGFEGGSEFRLRVGRAQRHSPQNCLPSAMAAAAACDASDGERVHLYSPRDGAIPFAPQPPTPPTDADVCLSAAHSLSILQFKRAFFSCLPLPRLAGKNLCGTMDPSCLLLPGCLLSPPSVCHRNRHSPSLVSLHQSRIDGMASFPLSFFCSLSLFLLFSFAYIYGRNAPTIMSTLITIKKELLHSGGQSLPIWREVA